MCQDINYIFCLFLRPKGADSNKDRTFPPHRGPSFYRHSSFHWQSSPSRASSSHFLSFYSVFPPFRNVFLCLQTLLMWFSQLVLALREKKILQPFNTEVTLICRRVFIITSQCTTPALHQYESTYQKSLLLHRYSTINSGISTKGVDVGCFIPFKCFFFFLDFCHWQQLTLYLCSYHDDVKVPYAHILLFFAQSRLQYT